MSAHLWEVEHSYYAAEGNYYSSGHHTEFETWDAFIAENGDCDFDMNLVYRFDWCAPSADEERSSHELRIYWMGQRKASCRSTYVRVTPNDEPRVRDWLEKRWEHMRAPWAPFQ